MLTPEILAEISTIDSQSRLRRFLQQHPLFDADATITALQGDSSRPAWTVTRLIRALEMIGHAKSNIGRAWKKYAAYLAALQDLQIRISTVFGEVSAAWDLGDYDRCVELLGAARDEAMNLGLIEPMANLLLAEGDCFLTMPVGSRADNLERALQTYGRALEFASGNPIRPTIEIQLATAFGERIYGDYADNLSEASTHLRHVLNDLTDSQPDLRALARTSLATAIIRGPSENPEAALNEAARLCELALEYRTPDTDPIGWAYSKIVLGDAMHILSKVRGAEPSDALQQYVDVVAVERRIADKHLVATALMRTSEIRLHDDFEAEDGASLSVPEPAIDTLNDCIRDLERALTLAGPGHLHLQAKIRYFLATAHYRLGDLAKALSVGSESLMHLRPDLDPHFCQRVAGLVGSIYARQGDWINCTAALEQGVEAANFTLDIRINLESRRDAMERWGTIHRWAAYAIARTGEHGRAAQVLEQGRARELADRLPLSASDVAVLDGVPDQLRDDFRAAKDRIVVAPFGVAGSAASRDLHLARSKIRSLPGCGSFLGIGDPLEIAQAAQRDCPLVFVDPTPYGTLLLSIWLDREQVNFESVFVDVSSREVYMQMLLGQVTEDALPAGSYLLGISGIDPNREFKPDLEALLPWLGENLARPISTLKCVRDAVGITLVLCGPVGVTPLHAAEWIQDGEVRCLLDTYSIRFAPSAGYAQVCLQRARAPRDSAADFVGIGNPSGNFRPLPAAESEVCEIAEMFGSRHSLIALKDDAKLAFLLQNAENADYLHLACHGSTELLGNGLGRIHLADGIFEIGGLLAPPKLHTRLTVLSACQTALWGMTKIVDETLSIASAFLSFGSTCVIATLWPVDDVATAALLIRCYQSLLSGATPPVALREAQRWLRALSVRELTSFGNRHPKFHDAILRNARLVAILNSSSPAEFPFVHPDYWAPFIAIGA